MVVNERDRLRLAHRLQGLMGEEATILMEHLPYGGIAGLVTQDDLVLFKAEIHTDMAELRSDVRLEMAELRSDLRLEMAELSAEIYKALNSQTLKIITVMTALNGLMFAGLKWG
jgi:hypothetical protein